MSNPEFQATNAFDRRPETDEGKYAESMRLKTSSVSIQGVKCINSKTSRVETGNAENFHTTAPWLGCAQAASTKFFKLGDRSKRDSTKNTGNDIYSQPSVVKY
ncbi:hypothetical protein PoMZ_03088 [Pyricularia oryzae]|uniref:Uncharacterized protein n=1 Tax=Pyricularia oryzae TaxID=318829 RepID=A0A4P7N6D2_PYROR|nr:hypothetical protein PoMZ_03088 [Pyricularia oryzae]